MHWIFTLIVTKLFENMPCVLLSLPESKWQMNNGFVVTQKSLIRLFEPAWSTSIRKFEFLNHLFNDMIYCTSKYKSEYQYQQRVQKHEQYMLIYAQKLLDSSNYIHTKYFQNLMKYTSWEKYCWNLSIIFTLKTQIKRV